MQSTAVRLFFAGIAAIALGGCANSAITPAASDPQLPEGWARGVSEGEVDANWLASFGNDQLSSLVAEAIDNNYSLNQERARLYQAQQAVVISRADRFPNLDLTLDGSRRGTEVFTGQRLLIETYNANLGANWTIDIWGRLSKAQQAAQLSLAAQRARLESARRTLAVNTSRQVFNAMEARQQMAVAARRLQNTEQSRDIVASGYRQGLNDALDLYLARNQVERERANFAQREQEHLEAVTNLQLSLARYPDGNLQLKGELPVMTAPIPEGLPSDLLSRRADLQEAWLNLLAADAELAVAHKNRFPNLSLVASGGRTSMEFSELINNGTSVWSFSGSLTQPLFQAGRLKALEEQARARVQQTEQQYLDLLFLAFAEVENAISRTQTLTTRYQSLLKSLDNSRAALDLALEQYQRGLVSYTTVLESQRQAFDAEATVVQLQNQLLQNRLTLYLELGGEFEME